MRFEEYHPQDLGSWIGRSSRMSTAEKMGVLKRCWIPPTNYDFHNDVEEDSSKKFRFEWLTTYSPWLQYSKKLKGALCLYCVLFPPKNAQGVLGSFIQTPFKNYKKMHEYCKNHSTNQWHLRAVKEAQKLHGRYSDQSISANGIQKNGGKEKGNHVFKHFECNILWYPRFATKRKTK